MSDNLPEAPQGEFVLFRSEDGQTRVECRFESDTLWLSQASIEGSAYWSVVPDDFDEMLERIRDIRASERRVFYE